MAASVQQARRPSTGKSGVTPCKHYLLNSLLGREVGVVSRRILPVREALLYDLTAGDGVPFVSGSQEDLFSERQRPFTEGCSPGIFLKHMDWLLQRSSAPVQMIACEKQASTHAALLRNTSEWLSAAEWQTKAPGIHFKGSGQGLVEYRHQNASDLKPPGIHRRATCFIYNDPNHVEDWCLTGEFMQSCPKFTTSLSTLGCNVGGLKRIDEEKRREWFLRVEVLCESLVQTWHDACLFSIGGADQWAYLITGPTKWREQITQECMRAAKKLEKRITAPPQVVWRKDDPGGFYQLERFLFLTKDEFARGVEL